MIDRDLIDNLYSVYYTSSILVADVEKGNLTSDYVVHRIKTLIENNVVEFDDYVKLKKALYERDI